MKRLSKVVALLTLVCALALGGFSLTRQMIAAAGEADAERLNRAILDYVAERNPHAPIKAFHRFPELLVTEAQRAKLDHCLVLAQAEVESAFRHDAVGSAGEIGLFQVLPSTAALFESQLGRFRRPVLRGHRDLGDLANPQVNTRFAMAYLRDILARKPNIKDALTEYNSGPTGRRHHYYRLVMGAYVEILERPELRCRFRETPRRQPVFAGLAGV